MKCSLTNQWEEFWVHVTFPAFPLVTCLPAFGIGFMFLLWFLTFFVTSVTDPKTLLLSCTVTSRNISTWILQLTFGFVSQSTRLSLNAIQVDTVAESGRTIAMADSEAAFASSCNRHLAWRTKTLRHCKHSWITKTQHLLLVRFCNTVHSKW